MATNLKPGERACPKCKEAIKVDATICKHCRTEFTPAEVAAAKADARKNTKHAAIGCLGLVFLVGCCSYYIGSYDPAASAPDKPGPTAKADAIVFYKSVMAAIKPCDAAGQDVASAGGSGDAVALYQAAAAMEASCLPVPTAVRDVDVPQSVGKEAFGKLTETREVCENAYLQRWSSAGKMKKALDANGSVGSLAELKESTDLVQAGTIACAAGLVGEIMSLGVTQADLDGTPVAKST